MYCTLQWRWQKKELQKESKNDSLLDTAELKSMTDLVAKLDGKESKKGGGSQT